QLEGLAGERGAIVEQEAEAFGTGHAAQGGSATGRGRQREEGGERRLAKPPRAGMLRSDMQVAGTDRKRHGGERAERERRVKKRARRHGKASPQTSAIPGVRSRVYARAASRS